MTSVEPAFRPVAGLIHKGKEQSPAYTTSCGGLNCSKLIEAMNRLGSDY